MVFESIVTDLLNRFLGDFVENLDSKQLKIGIWGGDVVLRDLVLKQTALNDLDLPVQTVYGRLGKLVLKIPWSNLYGASVEAKIEGLYLLVEPNSQVKYSADKEDKRLIDEKNKAIEKYEAVQKQEEEKGKPKADDSFTEKLVTQIIKNVQLTIDDIHIRYEDRQNNPGKPFAMGITLHNLTVQTTDANWKATVVEEMVTKIYKIISLEGLSVYWNCSTELYNTKTKDEYLSLFHSEIATNSCVPEHYKYILGPINLEARLKMNPKPDKDVPAFIIPKIHAELVIEKLAVGITRCQYKDIILFADAMALQSRGIPYRKYRPTHLSGYRGHYKDWWKFAYACILEEEIKRKKRNWDWNHMLEHRNICNEYSVAYKNCLKSKKKPDTQLKDLEKQLDVFNIVLIRQKIQLEVSKLDSDVINKKTSRWFGGWWSKTASDEDKQLESSTNILSQFQAAMTPEEKKKLFKAIGYQENSAPTTHPEPYIDNIVKFKLNNLEVRILDDALVVPDVLLAKLNGVKCSIETRGAANAIKFNINIDKLTTEGVQQDDFIPYLISSSDEESFLDVMFETNPLDKMCGQRINMTVNPLKIIFDTLTVKRCIDVFNIPSSTSLDLLSEMTAVKLNNIKEMSAAGLQYQIDQHTVVDLNINFIAPYIIIPHGGIYTETENILLLNLGHLRISSQPRNTNVVNLRDGLERERKLNEIVSQCYDVFNLDLSNVQVLLAQGDEDWKKVIEDESLVSPLHVLRPLNVHISFHKCLITDDPKLPLMKLNGELPLINIDITDAKLLLLLNLISSIHPFSPSEEQKFMVDTMQKYNSSTVINYLETPKIQMTEKKEKKFELSDNFVQFTELLGKFVIKEVKVVFSHQEMLTSPISVEATFQIQQLECELIQQNFNTDVHIHLGRIVLEKYINQKTINVIFTPQIHENEAYLKILFTQVNKHSPEFHSKYHSCESTLKIEFAKLEIKLHLESLKELMRFASELQAQLTEEEPVQKRDRRMSTMQGTLKDMKKKTSSIARLSRHLSQSSRHLSATYLGLNKSVINVKKTNLVVETIQFKLIAHLSELFVIFETEASLLSSLAIKNIDSDIIVKTTYTQIGIRMQELTIMDLNKANIHNKIMSVASDEVFNVQLVMYNTEKDKNYIGNPDKVDMSVKVNLGHIRICFINWYINNMLQFLSEFQVAQQAIHEASQAAARAAKDNLQSVYEKATKILIDIHIKAPDIIIPESSKGYQGFLIDLGFITINNSFKELDIKNELGVNAVVDQLILKLENLKMTRIELAQGKSEPTILHEIIMLKPVTCTIAVNRNLSGWYKSIPDVDISGKLETVELSLGQPDYKCIMRVLTGNLAEGAKCLPPIEKTSSDNMILQELSAHGSRKADAGADTDTTHTILRWDFIMKMFKIDLFTVASTDSLGEYSVNATRIGLGRFSLEGLAINGRLLTSDTITNSILLLNCVLIDTRPGRENNLNLILSRKRDAEMEEMQSYKDSTMGISRNMFDCTFQQKAGDTFIDIRIYSFNIIISLDYMMKLANFFTEFDDRLKSKSAPAPIKKSATRQEVVEESTSMLTFTLRVERPDIILVEHMDNISTRALILNTEVMCKLRISGEHQVINGVVKDFEMFTCCYDPSKRDITRKTLLEPVTMNIAGSSPEGKGLHIEALITDVALSVSPVTIELVSIISGTLTKMRSEEADESRLQEDYSKTWEILPYNTEDHWFLKTDVATEAINYVPQLESTVMKKVLNEKCILTMPKFTITIEAGVGSKTLPMLLLETTFLAKINDWSSQMYIDANLTVQMSYYNSYLALWEPLIEPVEVTTEKGLQTMPWSLNLELTMNDQNAEESNPPSILEDEVQELSMSQAAISIDISSKENLELTITKSFLEVVDNLSKSFASAMKTESEIKQADEEYPYKVKNHTGLLIILSLEKGMFRIAGESKHTEVLLESGAEAKLDLKSPDQLNIKSSMLVESTTDLINRELHIEIPEVNMNIKLPVNRADVRYFSIGPYGLISNIKVEEGIMIINLSSIINVYNNFDVPIDMYYMKHSGNELEYISTIKPDSVAHVPMKAVYSPTSEIFFSVSGYSVTSTPFVWKDLLVNVSVTKNLICVSKTHSEEMFVIKAIGELHQVYHENTLKRTMASTIYTINLRPAISLRNYLPYEIILLVQDSSQEFTIQPGDGTQLPTVDPGNCHLIIRLPSYLEKEWVCRHEVPLNLLEFSVWTFESHDSDTKVALDLGMHVANRNGTSLMCLYCPFWMLNKTGLMLSYRNSDENLNILHHPAQFRGPVLFSFNAKNFFGKKKASVRTETGDWSDKFSVDVAGSSGVVVCKNNNVLYQIGVNNRLTYNGLTKQITFTPYFVIINNATVAIECQELDRPGDPWTLIQPKECTSLWPASLQEDKLIKLRIVGTEEITAPFLITESHTTLLKLKNKYGGINVDTQITEGAIYINLACYEYGSAPAVIINNTKDTMNLWEKETVQIRKLPPNHKMFYTWENPSGQRVLVWEGGYKAEIQDDLRKDGLGEYSIGENNTVYWVSFLDGMQRILLFTCDPQVAEDAQSSKQFEVIQHEITLSLHGVGLSLVNNVKRKEVMYVGMASTGIIWETCRFNSKRFKQMSTKDNIAFESTYQHYMNQFQSHNRDNITTKYVIESKEVDFESLEMLKPHKKKIRRTYQTALWVQMKTSSHQMQLHAKLNKLQIDNQMHDCIFPVVLAPVPPPKTIVVGKALRPFAELSIVQLLMRDSQIKQFKYFKVLIQEFHVKVDLGFINAVMEIFQTSEFNDVEEKEHFLADTKLVNEHLFSLVSTHSLREQKSFYDLLHFSPLKIHLSFSMAGDGNQEIGSTPNFINVLLQGLGVTLTDLQDVIFKLAFFEREYTFLTQRQLISEATTHYVGQSVKQLYVLVLGLDVIGNPYGLVIGITQGVEDLFYEPFQGAIQGPGEFAEGIVLGVRSLFGHTVGGAAGAVSRITGAMGKGIAALTFDKEYQRKRRDQYNKKPATVQEGFARGGKGLVMGVFDGVTGVFTKPISGAKEQGVEGFFKGLGKGAVGLVTRPTAGVIDFASSSLDTVKRVTELGHDESNRLRYPRYVQADGLVRPYNKTLAYGNKILSELEKGKYSSTDSYASHFVIIEKKEVLLLTDKRIAYVEHSDLFGGWQICWAYTWGEITKEPKDVPKGVQIFVTTKKKKMFGSNDISKLVLIPDISIREALITKMNTYIIQIEDN